MKHSFLPLWTFMCVLSLPFWKNPFPHKTHLKGLSPEWIKRCRFREFWREKTFPQFEQTNVFFVSPWRTQTKKEKKNSVWGVMPLFEKIKKNILLDIWYRNCYFVVSHTINKAKTQKTQESVYNNSSHPLNQYVVSPPFAADRESISSDLSSWMWSIKPQEFFEDYVFQNVSNFFKLDVYWSCAAILVMSYMTFSTGWRWPGPFQDI